MTLMTLMTLKGLITADKICADQMFQRHQRPLFLGTYIVCRATQCKA